MAENLELKARCPDLDMARARVLDLPPRAHWVEEQTDTYFHTASGRLKLREIDGQQAQLIFYQRADNSAARVSFYHIVPVADPAALKAMLTAAWGQRVIVRKRREIYLWHNVRIHLDQVESLGSFVEFEAVLTSPDDRLDAPARLEELRRLLNLTPEDCLATSYGG